MSVIIALVPKIASIVLKRYKKDLSETNSIKYKCYVSLFILLSRKLISFFSEEMVKNKSMDFVFIILSVVTLLVALSHIWMYFDVLKADKEDEQFYYLTEF
jgi:nucleoside permease NupC